MGNVDKENKTWITLHRKIIDWQWYTNANTFRVFMHLLISASHDDSEYRGVIVKRGQVLTGRKELARKLDLSEREIRTAIDHLNGQEIAVETTNKFSVITIMNYNTYQNKPNQERPTKRPADSQSERPTNDHIQPPKQPLYQHSLNEGGEIEPENPKPILSNPGFSAEFMEKTWPYYLKTGKAKYKNIESQGVALRMLFKESGGNEQIAKDALQYAVANGYQGIQWYFKHKSNANGHAKRNGTLGYQQPITAADMPDIMQSIADDPRYK